jgi:hypothetical protein
MQQVPTDAPGKTEEVGGLCKGRTGNDLKKRGN